MARAKLTARTFPTDRRSASGPWASRRERSLIKQREEQCYRCSLIYKAARFMAVRRRRPLFLPPRPRRNRFIPASSDRARSTPQPCKGFACARRLCIRFPGLPLPAKTFVSVGSGNRYHALRDGLNNCSLDAVASILFRRGRRPRRPAPHRTDLTHLSHAARQPSLFRRETWHSFFVSF
jgi:hypothetical protein